MYVILGLPIARMVDVRSRRVILTCGITAWSIATTLCGLAQSFWQLFVARIGVGAGESCSGPATTFSMMADLVSAATNCRAIAVLNFGFIAGTGMSLLAGGAAIAWISSWPSISLPLLGELCDWQLVVHRRRTARFHSRGADDDGEGTDSSWCRSHRPDRQATIDPDPRGGFVTCCSTGPPTRRCFIGVASSTVLAFGGQAWHAAFFARTYGWSAPQFATIFRIAHRGSRAPSR